MTMTVDVVVVGTNQAALDAAVEAAQGGKSVLVITRMRGHEHRRSVRRALRATGVAEGRITVVLGVEVECIAGVGSVEAILARDVQTGRRLDINATALLTFEEPQVGTADQPTAAGCRSPSRRTSPP